VPCLDTPIKGPLAVRLGPDAIELGTRPDREGPESIPLDLGKRRGQIGPELTGTVCPKVSQCD
jgi:hypothetical protein